MENDKLKFELKSKGKDESSTDKGRKSKVKDETTKGKDEKGTYIIRLKERIKVGDVWKAKYHSTGIKLKNKKHWNNREETVYSGEPRYKEYNAQLKLFLADFKSKKEENAIIIEAEKNSPSFLKEFETFTNAIPNYDTRVKYNSVLSWLKRYRDNLGKKDVLISDITRDFAVGFKSYLENTTNQYGRKSSQSSTDKYVQIFKRICTYLEEEAMLYEFPKNVFTSIKLVETDGKKKAHLQFAEFERLKALEKERILIEFSDDEEEKDILKTIDQTMKVRNFFVLEIILGGVRVSDVLTLKWSNFFMLEEYEEMFSGRKALTKKVAYEYIAYKTKIEMKGVLEKEAFDFLLPFVLKEMEQLNYLNDPLAKSFCESIYLDGKINDIQFSMLIEMLRTNPKSSNRLIFAERDSDHILFKDYDARVNNDKWRRRLQSMTVPINESLKKIGKYCRLSYNLSTHVARHSVGQFMAENNFSAFEVMSGLGHKKLTTSQKYVKTIDPLEVSKKMINKKIFQSNK